MMRLCIIGAGGHGKVVADIAQKMGIYGKIFFLDDCDKHKCLDFPILGKTKDVFSYLENAEVFVAIGNSKIRGNFLEKLIAKNAKIATLIHPDASVSERISIGVGSVIMAGAVVNPESKFGKGCIINTAASVDHECVIEDYVHVSVGAHLCGNVRVGKFTWIGAGAIVNNNIYVCDNCVVGSGTVVINDIQEAGTYVGVPAKKIHRNGK